MVLTQRAECRQAHSTVSGKQLRKQACSINNSRRVRLQAPKRDAEDMATYLQDNGAKADYIHSSLNTQQRADAIKSLQNKTIDCLVGVNLMREGECLGSHTESLTINFTNVGKILLFLSMAPNGSKQPARELFGQPRSPATPPNHSPHQNTPKASTSRRCRW